MKQLFSLSRLALVAATLLGALCCSSSDPASDSGPSVGSGPSAGSDAPPIQMAIECEAEGSDLEVGAEPLVLAMRLVAETPASVAMTIDLSLETETVEGISPIPAEAVTLPESLLFPEQESEVNFEVVVDGEKLTPGTRYRLAISIWEQGGNAGFRPEDRSVALQVIRPEEPRGRAMRQIVFFEVNNCNPLNALEYRLEDGTPFFDAVVLFAANINYNSAEDRVYLHNNPNVQALLDHSETLLQPLREAGIKVYLGLLGNHDAAGLAQLSNWGAETWAREVAEACAAYGLDGVNLDDEYSKSPDLTNKWFAARTPAAGAQLAYELKSALAELCPWPTEVSVFEYGALKNLPAVIDNGTSHPQSEFLDILIPNYGAASVPYGDLDYSHCCGASIEINYYDTLSESYARNMFARGYGWCMWFGFDPSGSGGVKSNLTHSMKQFRTAAKIFYDSELQDPRAVYHKLGEGSYDPEPYELN